MKMTSYREILRLDYLGLSRTSIGATLGYSRNTVAEVLRRAQLKGVVFPLPSDMNDLELRDMLFPEKAREKNRKLPDCNKMHKELAKSGVTLTLLWEEYCNECKQNNEIP